jgi:TonB-dependent receptor
MVTCLLSVYLISYKIDAKEIKQKVEKEYRFNIPVQPLNTSLNELSDIDQISFLFPYDLVENKKGNPVKGLYSIAQALHVLLKNTGLEGELSNNKTFLIKPITIKKNNNDNYRKDNMKTKKTLIASILAVLFSSAHGAQELENSPLETDSGSVKDDSIEVISVTGIRGSRVKSINLKRHANSIVDGISAEDIGKLPDVTIADSLQRISGIQIQRDAGEGATVNIRGLPQVVTLLNGEQYLNAGNLGGSQPRLTDIPSQLVQGVTVYKSTDTHNALSGISGTIDLKTYRPFDFDTGFSAATSIEVSQGVKTKETDPLVSGLINYQNDSFGFLISATHSKANLGNDFNGNAFEGSGSMHNNSWGIQGWGVDVPQENRYITPQGYHAFNKVEERTRTGLNLAFQAYLGEGFEFIAEYFNTDLEEYTREVGINMSNRWQAAALPYWLMPTEQRATGAFQGENEWYAVQEYDVDAWRVNSFSRNRATDSDSRNMNLQLNYDNGDKLKGSVRYIKAKANQLGMNGQVQGDLSNWETTNPFNVRPFYPANIAGQYDQDRLSDIVGDNGGRFISPNPLGYSENPQLHYDTSGANPTWSGFDQVLAGNLGANASLADYMANLDSYAVGAYSSEDNNEESAQMSVFSFNGSYDFDDSFITNVDVGIRKSERSVQVQSFDLLSGFYAGNGASEPEGCQVLWKGIDVVMNDPRCNAGETITDSVTGEQTFQAYTANQPRRLDALNEVMWVDDLGSVKGIPGLWAADPTAFDNVTAYHEKVFGSANRFNRPGQTYDIDFNETSFYFVANFAHDIFSGNFGIKQVDTELLVKQNITGETLPYGLLQADAGDEVSRVTYTDYLPSLNVAANISDNFIVRFSASKTMTPLDLQNYGGGLVINRLDNTAEDRIDVAGASKTGNPNLNPWRASNFDLSAEYYIGEASMVSTAIFKIDIESFTKPGFEEGRFPDSDGIIRRTVPVSLQVQGSGASIEGIEISGKFAFSDFTNGLFSGFGIDTNFTYSPSSSNSTDIYGEELPFIDNSERLANFTAWYEANGFQFRLSYNYRSDRLAGSIPETALHYYQKSTEFVDISASYDINDEISVYINGSNITNEKEEYYIQWKDQYGWANEFESRYTVGVRAKF